MREGYLERKTETSKRIKSILEKDGLSPKILKTLVKSTVYSIDTGMGREEIELFHDPLVITKG
jgi:hypothetical protein